jgi:hypothetical protein
MDNIGLLIAIQRLHLLRVTGLSKKAEWRNEDKLPVRHSQTFMASAGDTRTIGVFTQPHLLSLTFPKG